MAIAFADNIRLNKALPDFERQQYVTFADMKAVRDARMPEMYLAVCLEDRAFYQYDKRNEVDETLGKWRKFESGNNIQVTVMPQPTSYLVKQCVQYLGETTLQYKHGFFYECVLRDSEYVWQAINLSGVVAIPNEDIDNLFVAE